MQDPKRIKAIREAANKLEEAEELLYGYNLPMARDIRTIEVEVLRYLIDGAEADNPDWGDNEDAE